MTQTCIHPNEATYEIFVGKMLLKLCWDCRREIVLRCHLYKPVPMVNIDGGSIGYGCRKCLGVYTSTDPGTCVCRGRKADCAREREAQRRFEAYAELVLWRPKKTEAA